MTQDVVSFVLRFVREVGDQQQSRWRGTIRHVQGSAERQFSSFAEAVRFMQDHTAEVVMDALKDSTELSLNHPLLDTLRLWGEFIPQYNQLLLEKFSEALTQSSSQFEELASAFAPWLARPNSAKVAELEAQVAELKATIAQLEAELAQLRSGEG